MWTLQKWAYLVPLPAEYIVGCLFLIKTGRIPYVISCVSCLLAKKEGKFQVFLFSRVKFSVLLNRKQDPTLCNNFDYSVGPTCFGATAVWYCTNRIKSALIETSLHSFRCPLPKVLCLCLCSAQIRVSFRNAHSTTRAQAKPFWLFRYLWVFRSHWRVVLYKSDQKRPFWSVS